MRVSFITATYNIVTAKRVEMLRRCVGSVANIIDCEHLIVDGGSADGTVELLKDLNVDFISEPDCGIYDALNKGVRRAKGEWIHVIGCDDYIFDIEALEKSLKEASETGAEIIITPVEKEGGSKTINLKACLYSIPYCHQGVLMKRSLIERLGGFDASLKLAGDYDLALKAHLGGAKEIVLPYKFAHYTTGGASSNWDKLHKEVTDIAAKQFNLNEKMMARFDETRCLPIRTLLPLLFNRRGIVRLGAVWQLIRNAVVFIGIKR